MTDALPIEISDRAAGHIRRLESWWRIHRTKAPNAVRQELERAFRLISLQPRIGPRALDVDLPDVRRIHMSRVWHYLYYRVLTAPERIEVLAVWSENREEGPPI